MGRGVGQACRILAGRNVVAKNLPCLLQGLKGDRFLAFLLLLRWLASCKAVHEGRLVVRAGA